MAILDVLLGFADLEVFDIEESQRMKHLFDKLKSARKTGVTFCVIPAFFSQLSVCSHYLGIDWAKLFL